MKKLKKIVFLLVGFSIFLIGVYVFTNTNINGIISIPNQNIISYNDLEFLNNQNIFGKAVKIDVSDLKVCNDKTTKGKMWIKLFGIIPIKQVDVEITKGEEVFIGGVPLGFSIKTKGLLVIGSNSVLGENDEQVSKEYNIQNGDIISKINGIEINCFEDVPKSLQLAENQTSIITILRDGKEIKCELIPTKDSQSGDYKIGVWAKDDANGVGTLTYIKCDGNRFGALGHAITDFETGAEIPISDGQVYKCTLVGITKAEKNNPGELRCVFLQSSKNKGNIEKNTKFGVYGNITDTSNIVDQNLTSEVGSRLIVKPGKASIISAVSGVREEYEIEIIKASFQPESDDKSMFFRVTDEKLLKLTGGILQGMSGSPILQNGKLIGAVTHVFVSDPTKGYGVYVDWMIKN